MLGGDGMKQEQNTREGVLLRRSPDCDVTVT
jgi:hypothetical protein